MTRKREADLPARRGLPDREAFREVVQADADGDEEGESAGRLVEAQNSGPLRSVRAQPPGLRACAHPVVIGHQPQQPGNQGTEENCGQTEERPP